jgi:hypothetical protein
MTATSEVTDVDTAIDDEQDKIVPSPPTSKEENSSVSDDGSCHLLEGRWTFWYTHRPTTFRNSLANYDSCLKKLGKHNVSFVV